MAGTLAYKGTTSIKPPAVASTWGYNTCTFFEDFDNFTRIDINNTLADGYNFYLNGKWPYCFSKPWVNPTATLSSDLSISNSILTIATDRSGFGQTLNSCASATTGKQFVGTASGGGWYREARCAFFPSGLKQADKSWPAFWGSSVEFLAQVALQFGELDIFEASPANGGTVFMDTTVHEWGNPAGHIRTNNGGAFTPTPADGAFHIYGMLWVPTASNAGTGLVRIYVDDVHVSACDVSYTVAGSPSPALVPSSPVGALNILDHHHFPLILGAGPNRPMQVDWVAQWGGTAL